MTLQIGIYDHNTGEQIVRDMTPEEIANFEQGALEKQTREAEAAQAKADKLEILAGLGLTEAQAIVLGLIPDTSKPHVREEKSETISLS
jgi:hypothetical protein